MSNLHGGNGDDDLGAGFAGGTAELMADGSSRKRRRRFIVLLLLLSLLGSTVLLDMYYLVTKKPVTEILPPAVAVAKALPPTFVASFYGVDAPMGVAVSPDGQQLYVSELQGNRLVRVFDRAGRELFSASQPQTNAGSRQPAYIAINPQGQLYVADRAQMRISIFGPDGRFLSDLKAAEDAGITSPLGVSFDRAGNLLVADTTGTEHKVVVLDPAGQLIRKIGTSGDGPGALVFPNQAAADSRGRIYVTNGNAGEVDRFGPDGSYLGVLAPGGGQRISLPRGIAVDHLDRLFAVDSVNSLVYVFDVSGDSPAYLYSFGGEGDGNGELTYPEGIAVDTSGRIYVADRVNYRIQAWSY